MRILDEAGRIIACPCCGEDDWCLQEVASAVDGLDHLPVVVMPAPPSASEQAEMDPYRCQADWEEVGSL